MAAMNDLTSKKAQKVIIYWDYENCPIPTRATSFGNVHDVIKRRIFSYLQYEVQVEARIYIAAHKLPNKIKQEMDICSAKNIDIPSWKPEAVDKRMLVDLALDLYEWKGHNICNAVVLISGDKDFGNILGRIHNCPEIAKLILIRLPRNDGRELPVNRNLYANLDYIVDSNNGTGIDVEELIDCKHGIYCNREKGDCNFYHHSTHYINQAKNIQSHKDEQKERFDPKTTEIRQKIPCKFGHNCKNWRQGNCHFYHDRPYLKSCHFGKNCKNWRQGKCPFYHAKQAPNDIKPPPPNPYQQQLYQQQNAIHVQQQYAQQQAQHIDGLLNYNDNDNDILMDYEQELMGPHSRQELMGMKISKLKQILKHKGMDENEYKHYLEKGEYINAILELEGDNNSNEWSCIMCTFLNKNESMRCSMCNHQRKM